MITLPSRILTFIPILAASATIASVASAAENGRVPAMEWEIATPARISDADAYRPVHHNGQNFSLAYYLGHFPTLANAVRMEPPHRGFIEIPVWRRAEDNAPHNARIMENILSLAWIYARDEPWNPFFGDPAVRTRLEAALQFWVEMQHSDGRFSEYGPRRWNLAATAFATKFIAETLVQLRDGPPVDAELLERVRAANRRALLVTFNDEGLWNLGTRFSNQYGNAFAGALAHLYLWPDDTEVATALKRQMLAGFEHFQSPAGFLYEENGPDWGYYFGTHHSNIQMAWHYAQGLDLDGLRPADLVRKEYEKSTEWLAYNAVPQPDGDRFFLNRAAETRLSRASFTRLETPLSEVVELARAFSLSEEERQERLTWSRAELEADWGSPPRLVRRGFASYSPYAFLHREHALSYPTDEERAAAYQKLPYISRDRFVHQRADSRLPAVYTFVRRPAYYAAFNTGPRNRDRSRRGLGLVWHPEFGILLQSQSNSTEFAWGTRIGAAGALVEAETVEARFAIAGVVVEPEPGARDLAEGELRLRYDLPGGRKHVRFGEEEIEVAIAFDIEAGVQRVVEQWPFLLREEDEVLVGDRRASIRRDGVVMIEVETDGEGTITERRGGLVDGLRLVALDLERHGDFRYRVRIAPAR